MSQKTPEKAVIYARVSTDMQTTDNQIPVLRGWAAQRSLMAGFSVKEGAEVVEVYTEDESAWRVGHQKELARLLRDAARGRFNVVYIWALDRLCREGIGPIFERVKKLAALGVRVYSYEEPWTLTPSSLEYDLMLAMSGFIAKYESDRRSDRTKAGIERKRKENGGRWGRRPGQKDKTPRKRRGKK